MQEWNTDINSTSKAIHNRHLYSSFGIQLKCMLPIYLTRILAILRCLAHTLKVEKGRHNDTPSQQRNNNN